MKPYLTYDQTFYIDNYYSSVDLTPHLLSKRTDTVDTLTKNRKSRLKEVIGKI